VGWGGGAPRGSAELQELLWTRGEDVCCCESALTALGGQTSGICAHQQGQATSAYAASPKTVIPGAWDLLQLVKQGLSWLHPPAQVPMPCITGARLLSTCLIARHWGMERNCFQQAEPAPVAVLFPLHCSTHQGHHGNVTRVVTPGPRDDTGFQG